MTTQQKSGNGKATAEATKTTAIADVKGGTPVVNPPAVIEKEKPAPVPPVEERINRVLELSSLVDKHETLLETQKKLQAFKLSADGHGDSLRLQDNRGNSFSTTNSAVIKAVMEVVKETLAEKIKEVENQIRF